MNVWIFRRFVFVWFYNCGWWMSAWWTSDFRYGWWKSEVMNVSCYLVGYECLRWWMSDKVRSQKKMTVLFGNFSQMADPPPFWEPLIQKKILSFILHFSPFNLNFCKLTKCFFACQISFISGGKNGVLGIWEVCGGGSPIPKSKCNKNGKILTFWWKPKMFLRV